MREFYTCVYSADHSHNLMYVTDKYTINIMNEEMIYIHTPSSRVCKKNNNISIIIINILYNNNVLLCVLL